MKLSLRPLVRDVRPLHITTEVYNGISDLLFMVLLTCGIWQWLESIVFAPLNGAYKAPHYNVHHYYHIT